MVVFIGRGIRLLTRTRAGLMMLLAPLLLAPIDFLLSTPDMFDPLQGDPARIPVSLGLLVFFDLLLSALLFQREVLKEKDIHRHEYRFVKGTFSYIFSKLWFVFFLAVYQGAVWSAVHTAANGFHFSIAQLVSILITLSLVAGIGGVLGLSASTLANRAYTTVGIVLFLAIGLLIISGSVIPVPHLARPAQLISLANPVRYAFESLLTISRYGREIMADACWQLPEKERISLSETQKQDCQCTGENLFSRCNFPGIHKFFTVAIEQPRPIAPTPDANLSQFPTQPLLRQGQTAEDYAKEVSTYTAQLETYQGSIDAYMGSLRQYAVDLANWQRVRATQIGNAEGVIGETIDHYGQGLQVNLPDHWLMMIDIGVGLIVLFGGIQKGKDVSQW